MNSNFDKKKMMNALTDPDVSIILVELENGQKELTYLTEKLQLSTNEIKNRLSYVIECGFVNVIQDDKKTIFAADKNKLNEIMETDENFTSVIDGLTELDQFLN